MAAPYDKYPATPHRCLIFVMNRWPVIKSKVQHQIKGATSNQRCNIKSKVQHQIKGARHQIKGVAYHIDRSCVVKLYVYVFELKM